MNTAELAEKVAAEHELGKGEAKAVVETVLAAIVEAAKAGDEVALSGFGRFKVTSRAARQGRNPATGQQIEIAASKKRAFTPAKPVRDAMNPAAAAKSKAAPAAKKAAPAKKAPAKKG